MRCRRCNTARHVHHSVYFDGWFCTSCLDHLYDTEELSHKARPTTTRGASRFDGYRTGEASS